MFNFQGVNDAETSVTLDLHFKKVDLGRFSNVNIEIAKKVALVAACLIIANYYLTSCLVGVAAGVAGVMSKTWTPTQAEGLYGEIEKAGAAVQLGIVMVAWALTPVFTVLAMTAVTSALLKDAYPQAV